MFGKKSKAVVAGLSLVMALAPAVPAFAADTTTAPEVEKVLELNQGSTVKATFEFDAEGTQLSYTDKNGKTVQTEKDVPTLTIANVTIDNTATGDGKLDKNGSMSASFDHAGYYAWYVTEKSNTYTGDGVMTYDPDTVYTVIATVQNTDDGLATPVYTIIKGRQETVSASKKEGTAKFTNQYTENTDDKDNAGSELVVKKETTGTQADKSKKFTFTVQFTEPKVNNTTKDTDTTNDWDVSKISTEAVGKVTDIKNEGNGKFTFTAANAEGVKFSNVMIGTTYTVTETEAGKDGYTTTTAYVAGSNEVAEGETAYVAEKAENKATVTNNKEGEVITGVIMNNAPFIVMIGVAAAGVAAYGAAKRKLEK